MTNDRPVDRRTLRSALALAAAAPSIRNSQPWRWTVDPRNVDLHANPRRRPPTTDAQTRDMLVSCGAALHHLRVALAASWFACEVHRMPDPADPGHLAALEMRPRPAGAVDLALAAAILRRRSDRRRFSVREVPDIFVTELIGRAEAEGASLRPVTAAGSRARLMDAICAAPDNLIYRPVHGEPDRTVLMVLATATDDALARLRAGEALSAALLSATALGLATCALSRPLDVGTSRQILVDELFDGAADPQVVLRVGWPPAGHPLPPTPRRPIDSMITWLPGNR